MPIPCCSGIVLVAGILLRSRSSSLLLVLGGGTMTHLVLDGMWNIPNTLFWPALGGFLSLLSRLFRQRLHH